ncbi:hypothetical protein [Sporocytophaga myxococcoides]|uniref:hypothetical protein n=1 Tax=Sporocytophaga myxococcoides TaxID=153721 RepID=UPI0004208C23|nr:hypothetical protein [Sporocytophaga myxococcoides]
MAKTKSKETKKSSKPAAKKSKETTQKAAKKSAVKKVVSKKAAVKKTVAKKAAVKKAVVKAVAKKTVAKKAVVKAVAKKAVIAKKADGKKTLPPKAAAKKTANKKVEVKKTATKPATKAAVVSKNIAPKPSKEVKVTKQEVKVSKTAEKKVVSKTAVPVKKAEPASKTTSKKPEVKASAPTEPVKAAPKPEIKKEPLIPRKPDIYIPHLEDNFDTSNRAIPDIDLNADKKIELKKELLNKCIEMQSNIVQTAKKAMDDAQESANEEEGASGEERFEGFRETMQITRDMYARQLQEGINSLSLLKRIFLNPQESIGLGSVVYTELQNYFISVSLGETKLAEKNSFIAISTMTPLYHAMAGKKKGDKFVFRDKEYTILETF